MDIAEIVLDLCGPRGAAADTIRSRQALSPSHRLAAVVAAALREPRFAERWNDESDTSFRPMAVASFDLCRVKRLSVEARALRVRDLCLRKRRDFLADILGEPIAGRVVTWLGLTDWTTFAPRDWVLFFAIATRESAHSPLGHVRRITPVLLRQFGFMPEALRRPAVLNVVSRLTVPAGRWEKLRVCLQRAEPARRAELLRQAASLKMPGDFWDFYHRCEGKYWRPFLIPVACDQSEFLRPLTSPLEMAAEGEAMRNCLAIRVSRVHNGSRVYLKLRAGGWVNAELRREADGWVPGEILGPENAAVPAEAHRRVHTELLRLAQLIPVAGPPSGLMEQNAYLGKLRHSLRAFRAGKDLAKVTAALASIQGKSQSWSHRAFVIFEMRTGAYVQFAASPDGTEYLCEIASHKYQSAVGTLLTAEAVDVIEKGGFTWPHGVGNFLRWFPASSTQDIRAMAELVLTVFACIFRCRKGGRMSVMTHFPDTAAELPGPLIPRPTANPQQFPATRRAPNLPP